MVFINIFCAIICIIGVCTGYSRQKLFLLATSLLLFLVNFTLALLLVVK